MIKPTIEQIQAEIKEKGYHEIDAEYFFHHYEAIGWIRVVGRKVIPIQKRKSVLVTWHKSKRNGDTPDYMKS